MKFVVSTTKRVALPPADGVAEPLPDASVCAPVDGDDAPVAVFLVEDRDVARTLHDPVVAAVGALPHQCRDAVGQAAFAGIRIEVRLERPDAVARAGARLGLPGVRRVRNLPVARIDDERRLLGDLPRPSVVLPEAVVLVPANRRFGDRAAAHRRAFGARQPLRRLFLFDLLTLGDFLVGQRLAPLEARRALERNRAPRIARHPAGRDRPTPCAAASTTRVEPGCAFVGALRALRSVAMAAPTTAATASVSDRR